MTPRPILVALLLALAAPALAAHPTARNADRERRALRRAHDQVRRAELTAARAALGEIRREHANWRKALGRPAAPPPARQLLERQAQRPASAAKADHEAAAIARALAATARDARRSAATALDDARRDATTARGPEPPEPPPADDQAALAQREAAALRHAARRRDDAARLLATRDATRLWDDTAAAAHRAADAAAPGTPAGPAGDARVAARERARLLATSRQRLAAARRLAADASAWIIEDGPPRATPRVERPDGPHPAAVDAERLAMSRLASRERLAVAAGIGRQAHGAADAAHRAATWRNDDAAARAGERARHQHADERLQAAKDATRADELAAAASALERERAVLRAAVGDRDAAAAAPAARAAPAAHAAAAASARRRAGERQAGERAVAGELQSVVRERQRAVEGRDELYARQLERATRWAIHNAEKATKSDDKLRGDLVRQVLELADEMEHEAAEAEARKKKGREK